MCSVTVLTMLHVMLSWPLVSSAAHTRLSPGRTLTQCPHSPGCWADTAWAPIAGWVWHQRKLGTTQDTALWKLRRTSRHCTVGHHTDKSHSFAIKGFLRRTAMILYRHPFWPYRCLKTTNCPGCIGARTRRAHVPQSRGWGQAPASNVTCIQTQEPR